MNYITEANYIKDYKISVVFNNNKSGIVDLETIVFNDHRAIFKELQELEKFKKFKVDMDTIIWENGLDLAPEFIYGMIG